MKRFMTYIILMLLFLVEGSAMAYAHESVDTDFNDDMPLGLRYTKKHPLIIVFDWNFYPYSFCNDNGVPDGYHVDIVHELLDIIHIPYELHMKDWSNVYGDVKQRRAHLMIDLEKFDSDLTLPFGASSFGQYKVALACSKKVKTVSRLADIPTTDTLYLRRGDYIDDYLRHSVDTLPCHTAYLEPYTGLQGVISGRVKYYAWGYESLRQMMRTMRNSENIQLVSLSDIPAGQFRFRSVDRTLLRKLDLLFDRIEDSGHYNMVNKKWASISNSNHTTTIKDRKVLFPLVFFVLLFVVAAICIILIFRVGRSASFLRKEFISITDKVIAAENCQIAVFDLKKMRINNVRGTILPPDGVTLHAFESLIHPDDILAEYAMRNAIINGDRDIPETQFRIQNHGSDEYIPVHVTLKVRRQKRGKSRIVFMVMQEITIGGLYTQK